MTTGSLVVVLNIRESLITGRRPFERAALLARAPRDEVLDLASELVSAETATLQFQTVSESLNAQFRLIAGSAGGSFQ